MSTLRSDPRRATRTTGQTMGSVWRAAAGAPITDALLHWPADLFALSSVLLAEAQAFRFALSPPTGRQWPPGERASWSDAVGCCVQCSTSCAPGEVGQPAEDSDAAGWPEIAAASSMRDPLAERLLIGRRPSPPAPRPASPALCRLPL
jgi:hypothetical protein